jgi:putative transposase
MSRVRRPQGGVGRSGRAGSQKSRSSGFCGSRKAGCLRRTFAAGTGISSATFFKWKSRFGGLDVSDARRLKALEDENGKLKKLLAEAMLDVSMLKDIAAKKF